MLEGMIKRETLGGFFQLGRLMPGMAVRRNGRRKMYQLINAGTVLGMFLQVAPAAGLAGLCYAVVRLARLRTRGVQIRWSKEALRVVFVCYLTGLAGLVLTPRNFWSHLWGLICLGYSGTEIQFSGGSIQLVPAFVRWLSGQTALGSWVKTMLVGNVLMFVPMGLLVPLVFCRVTAKKMLRLAVILPLAVEAVQPWIGRSFDLDDIIGNLLGILLGFALYCLAGKAAAKRKGKGQKSNICADGGEGV